MAETLTFHIPGGLAKTDMVIRTAKKLRTLDKGINISTYDAVQGLQWNGGRLIFNNKFVPDPSLPRYTDVTVENPQAAVERVARLNDEGISFSLTLNNTLECIDIDNEIGNYLLDRLHNDMNSVTVATEALYKHISTHFPKYSLIASMCNILWKIEDCAEACKRFDRVVMLPAFAYLPELLATLPLEKLVFVLNETCYLFCLRKDHYDYISQCNLSGNTSREDQMKNLLNLKCFPHSVPGYTGRVREPFENEFNANVSRIWQAQLEQERHQGISDKGHNYNISRTARGNLIRLGVTHFKVQGRELPEGEFEQKVVGFLEMIIREDM